MRYVILTLFTSLITGLGITRAQKISNVITADSVIAPPVENITVVSSPNIADMPILEFLPEAKIRSWWPDTGTHYFMPNALDPDASKKPRTNRQEKPESEDK